MNQQYPVHSLGCDVIHEAILPVFLRMLDYQLTIPLHHIMAYLELIDNHKTDMEITQTLCQYRLELTLEMICMAQQMATWQFHFPCNSHQRVDVEIEIPI